jgi:hypothetical protein
MKKEVFSVSKIRNAPLKEKGQKPPMRKEDSTFQKQEIQPQKTRGAQPLMKKEVSSLSEIRTAPLKEKSQKPPMKKEASAFQKQETPRSHPISHIQNDGDTFSAVSLRKNEQ